MDQVREYSAVVNQYSVLIYAVLIVVMILMCYMSMCKEGMTSSPEPVVVHGTSPADADYWAKMYNGGRVTFDKTGKVVVDEYGNTVYKPSKWEFDPSECDLDWDESKPYGGQCDLGDKKESLVSGPYGCELASDEYNRAGGYPYPSSVGQASIRSVISSGAVIRNKSERSEDARDQAHGHQGEAEWRRAHESGEYYQPGEFGGAHGDYKRYDERYLNGSLHGN